MKKLNFTILTVAIAIAIFSCGKPKGNNIIGSWKFSAVSSTNEIPADIKEKMQETFDEMKASYLLVIKADSTFEHTISESTSTGRWALSPDSKTLTLSYDDGTKEVSNIVELSDKEMVTSVEINDYKNTITFEKQEEQK